MHNHESVHTQMYRGFKLKMFHDHANDPYHYMDGLWPMLVFGSRYRAEKNDATEAFEITDEQFEANPFPYEKTYCMQDAVGVMDRHINKKRTEHQKQLKTWIRNKVPVLYRKATDPRLTNTQVIS